MRRFIRVAMIVGLLGFGLATGPAAEAHGTCTDTVTISQTPPNPLKMNPTVYYSGRGTCTATHYMTIGIYLYLDNPGQCCTWVDVDSNENPSATTIAVDDSYSPSVCTVFNLGSHHYWTAESLFLVSNPGGGFDGHPPGYEAFKRLDFNCPLAVLP